jgi:hypothetical protein
MHTHIPHSILVNDTTCMPCRSSADMMNRIISTILQNIDPAGKKRNEALGTLQIVMQCRREPELLSDMRLRIKSGSCLNTYV